MKHCSILNLYWLFFGFAIIAVTGCNKDNVNLINTASAIKDGQPWSAEALADPNFVYGDSLTIISTFIRDKYGVRREGTAFFPVSLKEVTYGLVDSIKYRDSLHVQAAYYIFNSHGDVLLHTLLPDKAADNYLILESYNRQTGEIVLSFQVLFKTNYPEPYPNWQMEFTEGKIWVTLSP